MYSLKKEYFACLALRHTPGLGAKSWSRILHHYPSAYDALRDARNWPGQAFASEKSASAAIKDLWRTKAENEYHAALNHRFGLLPWSHPVFPEKLKALACPPAYLYYYGDLTLLNNPAVAIVGSRKSSSLGLEYASRISGELSEKGITVVSGFAKGIDSCAHTSALNGVGSTIAVLGTGLDVDSYPPDSHGLRRGMIESGLLISEFAPGTRPFARNFPFRNRLISGLSVGVLVAEADITSGSLITAGLAAEQGREVMALPGPLGDSRFAGCLKLIKEGAALVETADDVLMSIRHTLSCEVGQEKRSDAVSITKPRSKVVPAQENNISEQIDCAKTAINIDLLDPPDSDIAKVLQEGGRLHIDEIARNAGIDVSVAGAVILGMEIKGIVVRFPGMYYDLKRC